MHGKRVRQRPQLALRSEVVANMRGRIPLQVTIDGSHFETHSTYVFAAGGAVLTIATVLPARGLAFELVSTYTGAPGVPRHATHLSLGPAGELAQSWHEEHGDAPAPSSDPRACAYDHAHQLIEQLTRHGHQLTVAVEEQSFAAIERVE